MKTKTSVTLSPDVLAAMDGVIGPGGNRSRYIEKVLRRHLRELARAERGRRDAEIYARMTDEERQEAADAAAEALEAVWEITDPGEVEPLGDTERVRAAG